MLPQHRGHVPRLLLHAAKCAAVALVTSVCSAQPAPAECAAGAAPSGTAACLPTARPATAAACAACAKHSATGEPTDGATAHVAARTTNAAAGPAVAIAIATPVLVAIAAPVAIAATLAVSRGRATAAA